VKNALAQGNLHRVVFRLHVQPFVLKLLNNLDPSMEPLHSLEHISDILIKRPVIVHDIDKFQIVSFSDLVIVRIVRRCNLDGTGTEFHIDHFVADNGKPADGEGVDGVFAM
jgi:hypothetical protein